MFLAPLSDVLRIVVISACAYLSLIVALRAAGKRSLAKLNAFDLVVTVALGSTLATVLLSKDVSLIEGVLAFAMLALLQWIVSRVSVQSTRFARLIRSQPRLLLKDGVFLTDAMTKERVMRAEVEGAIRRGGHGRIEEIAAVVLESDGSMSVIAKDGEGWPLSALRCIRGADPERSPPEA